MPRLRGSDESSLSLLLSRQWGPWPRAPRSSFRPDRPPDSPLLLVNEARNDLYGRGTSRKTFLALASEIRAAQVSSLCRVQQHDSGHEGVSEAGRHYGGHR